MDETARHCEPAASVIRRLGGLSSVAEITGVSSTQVLRWRLPKERGGTGGAIPHWHIQKLMAAARERGVPLEAGDVLPTTGAAA